MRQYIYDDNYFSVIDTQEKAYWLGFLMADGYTYHNKKQKRLRLALSPKDEDHLHKFIRSLNSNLNIKYNKGSPYVDINCTSMCNDLANYGIVPNKSNSEIIPDIEEELISHFVRGLFDGDGSWDYRKTENHEMLRFYMLSSYEALLHMKAILENHDVNFSSKALFQRSGIWCLLCNKREDVLRIIDYIYKDATIYMDRKYAQAMHFKNYKPKRLNKGAAQEIRALYKTGKYSQSTLGKMFNTSRSNIGLIVNMKSLV